MRRRGPLPHNRQCCAVVETAFSDPLHVTKGEGATGEERGNSAHGDSGSAIGDARTEYHPRDVLPRISSSPDNPPHKPHQQQ